MSETNPVWKLCAIGLVVGLALVYGHPSHGQERPLAGFSAGRPMTVSPHVLDSVDAQTGVRTNARFSTGDWVESLERSAHSAELNALRLVWDLSFGAGDQLEFGASISGAYDRPEPGSQNIRLDRAVAFGRYAFDRGEDGAPIAFTFGLGRNLYLPGAMFAELGAQLGWNANRELAWNLDAWGATEIPNNAETVFFAGIGGGPRWQPVGWFDLGLDFVGSVSSLSDESADSDSLAWELRTGLQSGFTFAESHRIELAAERTLVGASIEEIVTVHLNWRFVWSTDDGLLTLDDDGGPPPEPPEEGNTLQGL